MEAVQQDEELDIAVPHTKVEAPATATAANLPAQVPVGLPSAPTHQAETTDEDRELEELMKMAGQA
jgi:hypothetical protein